MTSGLRDTRDVLDALIADGEAEGFGTRYDTDILAALRELRAYRRGEISCPNCLRQEADEELPAEF